MSDQHIVLARRKAAVKALNFFKYMPVKSANNPFAFIGDKPGKEVAARIISMNRAHHPRGGDINNIAQTLEDSSRTGFGNCKEKAAIVYASIKSDPYLAPQQTGQIDHYVSMVGSIGYDHAFCVIADRPVTHNMAVHQLGHRAVIVDGWTEDWYCPNLDIVNRTLSSAITFPNPRQSWVRIRVARHHLSLLETLDFTTRKVQTSELSMIHRD